MSTKFETGQQQSCSQFALCRPTYTAIRDVQSTVCKISVLNFSTVASVVLVLVIYTRIVLLDTKGGTRNFHAAVQHTVARWSSLDLRFSRSDLDLTSARIMTWSLTSPHL